MARQFKNWDITPLLAAAERWVDTCLIADGSIFSGERLWTSALVEEVYRAFVDHPDEGDDDFMTKLKRQVDRASPSARRLAAEMLWGLLLFPSNMKARTKRQQICAIWDLSGQRLSESETFLETDVLFGVGSGGPGFNNYRPEELAFLMTLTRDLKSKNEATRRRSLKEYDAFFGWIESVPMQGQRQYRHMLRYFAFPDLVERISSNNDRQKILEAFGAASVRETRGWSDRRLDDEILSLRRRLEKDYPSQVLDFYDPPLREKWAQDRKIRTMEGEITVVVPDDDDVEEKTDKPTSRQSIQIQSRLAEIGATMGFKIWIPKSDRGQVGQLVSDLAIKSFIEELPINYDSTTLDTIRQIDVLWMKGRSMVRAFEVEHTTAVYSGLLRMADLLALQPNMDIRLHIVAPDERREKVFKEMLRPVFSLLGRGPLSRSCTFISYESIEAICRLPHLTHTNDSLLAEYEEHAEQDQI